MENGIVKWEFQGSEVRTVDVQGSAWWVAKDVCKILGIVKTNRAVSGLDDDERGVHTVSTPSGNQEMLVVSESGLYSLILRSRKQEAIAFKRWITHEVLPAIRRTGSYTAPTMTAEAAQVLVRSLQEYAEENATLKIQNQKFRHALYRCVPDREKFGTEGKNGLPRVHFRRSYWQGQKNRFYLTSDEVAAVQLLLPLFASSVEFEPKHIMGF